MTTIINFSNPMEALKNHIKNHEQVTEAVDLSECTDWRFYGNAELLIYKGSQIMFACSYETYWEDVYITHMYDRDAKLVLEYEVEY